MKKPASDFIRRTRIRVRQEVASSDVLRAERKRQQISWRIPAVLRELGWHIIFWFILLIRYWNHREPDLLLTSLTLWTTGAIFLRQANISERLFAGKALPVYAHLPFRDADAFALQWRKVWKSALWPFASYFLVYAACALTERWHPVSLVVSAAFAALLTAVVYVLALLLAICSWGMGAIIAGASFCLLAILPWFSLEHFGFILRSMAPEMWLFIPTGWINFAFASGWLRGVPSSWSLLVPAIGILLLAPFARKRLDAQFSLRRLLETGSARASEGLDSNSVSLPEQPAAEVEQAILSGALQKRAEWEREGWIEALTFYFLNSRERRIADFLIGGNAGWSAAYYRALVSMVLIGAAVLALGIRSTGALALAAVVVLIQAVPTFGWSFSGLSERAVTINGNAPMYAGFPLGFSEMGRFFLKVHLIRYALGLPVFLALGAFVGFQIEFGTEAVTLFALRLWATAVLLQPMLIAAAHLGIDWEKTQSGPGPLAVHLLIFVLLAGFGAGALFSQNIALAGASLFGLLAVSLLTFAWKRRRFDRLREDLVWPAEQ